MKKQWFLIIFFVFASFLGASTTNAAATGQAVVESKVNFRHEASKLSESYGILKVGTVLEVRGETGASSWLPVRFNGRDGFVHASYVTYTPQWQIDGLQAVAFAEHLKGNVSYQYGVRNVGKLIFDCSSFTQYVYQQALGIDIKWGSKIQEQTSLDVDKPDLRVGDLVFFTVGNSTQIGHVGIYIGGGDFIHNLSTFSAVTVSNLSAGYWSNHFVIGGRIIL